MAVYKLVCPHCDAVMKSPKPVPAGKKIKCAKCGEVFTQDADDELDVVASDEPPRKKAAAKGKPDAKTAVKSKGQPAKPAPPAAKKRVDDDEEDSGGTYGFVEGDAPKTVDDDDDDEEDDERTKQQKKDLEFALDTSIKDPRGPAQKAVIFPSNLLILFGAIPFLLYFFGILWMLWPFFFADRVVPPDAVFHWEHPRRRFTRSTRT